MNPIIAANWKMNMTINEGLVLIDNILKDSSPEISQIIFFPPSTALKSISDKLLNTGYKVGVQNIHHEQSGAYTGEISAHMIKPLGVDYAIIGHSERRQYFMETDHLVNRKIHNAIAENLTPIVCIGETLEERESGETLEVLKKQLASAFSDVDRNAKLIVAYEPVWAIGTGKSATSNQVDKTHRFINEILNEFFETLPQILYGGSVNAENAAELFEIKNVDGFLVGGASLNSENFCQIIKNIT